MCLIYFFFPFRFVLFFRGTANDRTEGQLAQPILELLQHLFPKQTHSGARTEKRGLLPPHTHPIAPLLLPCGKGSLTTLG